ncbi:MAG: hypothetical protein HOD60_08910 [Candidatus Nitrosopelagicus sp.]|jgi:hypothetical protein|nr:hypothetical protein [Candidatus Nitrosopelagicus sp.]
MKIQDYLLNTKLGIKQLLIIPVVLISLFFLGWCGTLKPDYLILTLGISYALVTISFVLTRNILVPTSLFVIYNTIVIILSGNTPGLIYAIGYGLIQSLFIGLVFYLVNMFDKKPDAKISHLDIISIIIITVILTAGSVIVAI